MSNEIPGNENLTNKTVEYPSKKFKDCGKIMFESYNNLIFYA